MKQHPYGVPVSVKPTRHVDSACGIAAPAGASPDFYVDRGRAMVSLGPTGSRHCTYRCAFCYVPGGFPQYPTTEVPDVAAWLAVRRDEYDIVYISADTDSFAPPRQRDGLKLLAAVAELGVDVLFTTRAPLRPETISAMGNINDALASSGRLLIACISVSQLEHPGLEPPPIPSPSLRLEQLGELRQAGLRTALTVRPLIPGIPAEEYAEIARRGATNSDVVITGDYYADLAGIVVHRTERALGAPIDAQPQGIGPLYFSTTNDPRWLTYRHTDAIRALGSACAEENVPLFMGSESAVRYLRGR